MTQTLVDAATAALRILDSYGPDNEQNDPPLVAARSRLRDAIAGELRTRPAPATELDDARARLAAWAALIERPAADGDNRLQVSADTAGEHARDLRLLMAEVEEHRHSFALRWQADMRAIKRWQAAGPGRELTWPDHADLVVWLLGEIDQRDGVLRAAADFVEEEADMRSAAGSEHSDYEREPRELAERLRAAFA